MTGSEFSTHDRSESVVRAPRRLSRYDLVLAVIPTAFLVGFLVAGVAEVPLWLAMSGAATVGALALVDGLFLNPPRRPSAGSGPA